ncbi:MAG: alpha/beta hydrolase [Methanoregula sp.]|nr:alpha/beta hydrolase [Methanoregula sp.]
MNRTALFTLTIALTICLLASAGCTGTSGTSAQPQVVTTQTPPAVSFNATPVQYAQVNGVMLGYREFGSGEPVLISLYSDDAAGLMTALGYDSMHVYGVSMGSSVSQQLAIDHPERVQKVVLDSSAYSVRLPETKKLLGEIEGAAASPAVTEGVHREAQANLAWNGSWDGLSGIHKDVMLVVGTNDDLTPDPVSVRMAGQINGSWLVRFKGLPHAASHYKPVEYGENALYFLGMDESP